MQGWLIFKHSVLMVYRNRLHALKICAFPTLILVLADMMIVRAGDAPGTKTVLLLPVSIIAMLWVAVNWHRFVLLSEYPEGWIPKPQFPLMLGYLGRLLLFGAIFILISIPIGIVAAVALAGSNGDSAMGLFIFLALFALIIIRSTGYLPFFRQRPWAKN